MMAMLAILDHYTVLLISCLVLQRKGKAFHLQEYGNYLRFAIRYLELIADAAKPITIVIEPSCYKVQGLASYCCWMLKTG